MKKTFDKHLTDKGYKWDFIPHPFKIVKKL